MHNNNDFFSNVIFRCIHFGRARAKLRKRLIRPRVLGVQGSRERERKKNEWEKENKRGRDRERENKGMN